MTKQKIFILPAILLLVAVFPSCSKFLDVVPKGKLIASTVNDYDLLMNDPSFYQSLSGGGWQIAALMGDEIAAEESYFNRTPAIYQRLFRWEALIYGDTDQSSELRTFLSNIYTCNKVISEVLDASAGADQQKKVIRAEALATRAFTYFQIINFYAKPYTSSSATTDPGFPIIRTADVNQAGFKRNSVQEVYDFIIGDLKEAIPLLPAQATYKTRMNKAAAEGILGKVFLFMGQANDALLMLKAAFADNNAVSGGAKLYNYNIELTAGGAFLPIGQNGPNSPFVNYNDFTESLVAKTYGNSIASGSYGTVITPQAAALYGNSDQRLKFYSATFNDRRPNLTGRLRKYGVQYSKFGLQLPDLYLLLAESKARLNDLSGAVADLETLRKNRMPATDAAVPATAAADQRSLLRFIMDERIREFAAEGYRWFDMRRISVDPLLKGIAFTHTIYKDDGTTILITLDQPNRLVLRIPSYILSLNPDMVDNP